MNMSVFRNIRAGAATRRIELRIETFNLFNWVNFGLPGRQRRRTSTRSAPSPAPVGDQREMQLAIKFYF